MISVVGAGPAGLITARESSSKGVKTTVYEEHNEIGKPVQCTGLVSTSGLRKLKVDYSDAVMNVVKCARFISPSGSVVEFRKSGGYATVLDRSRFDRIVYEEALSAGTNVVLGHRVKTLSELEGIKVLADGAGGLVNTELGLAPRYIVGYQVEAKMDMDMDMVELHFGSFAPGFFAWRVPVDDHLVRFGLGYDPEIASRIHESYDPRTALKFLAKLRGYSFEVLSEQGGMIPIYDGRPVVQGDIALVGDAATHVKATTGGGIAIGGECAMNLGSILGEQKPLKDYQKVCDESVKKILELHLAVHNFQTKLSDGEIENLFSMVDDELVRIIEKHGEMEDITRLASELKAYAMSHPFKMMKAMKFMRYADRNMLSLLGM